VKVYLDMCSIQRPLDSQDDVRVVTEAQAVLGVLRLCESGQVTPVGSDALLFELEKNPHPIRKDYAAVVLSNAAVFTATDQRVEARAASSPSSQTGEHAHQPRARFLRAGWMRCGDLF
jgi:hypothetical protein